MDTLSHTQHNIEIHKNKEAWDKKPLLQKIYAGFYQRIKDEIDFSLEGDIVELGSGLGNIKNVIPEVITTDIFDNPWIDSVESAYNLSFKDNSVSHLIMFDVFHHLEYPVSAFREIERILLPKGKVIIFDPDMSLVGLLVYGLLHHEPIGLRKPIKNDKLPKKTLEGLGYYAAQANSNRMFINKNGKKMKDFLINWEIMKAKRYSDISYVLSGGYGKRAFYNENQLPFVRKLDQMFNQLPRIFSTRLMVVLQQR